ncbi:hypothetical protein PMG11_08001 [Penicillium brasilianum]|uniref:Tachykinin family protein n=1 Tax=Penicillium brasilianum TaxID=104259 RepID=A0A0F7TU64_PENBI|nr:hypothetical protein PMG11_08001 [Penicillium brasilianum]
MASDPKFVKAVPTTKQRIKRVSGDFLWVNYQDDKSQNRESVRSKQSFVRTRHHRLQREKKSLQSKLIATPASKCRPSSSTTGVVGESTCGRYDLSSNQDDDDHFPEQSVIMPSVQVGVLDGVPDLVIQTRQNPNVYFQHYHVYSARSCFPLCPSEMTFWFWRKVLDYPPLMQIKLSISASHRAAILRASGAPALVVQKPMQDTLRLRLGMIKAIQDIFRDESKLYTESTAFAISHLIVSEGFDANKEAVEAHMNGMIKIIALTGGLNNLDGGTLSMIYSCVFLHGMIQERPPAIPMCAKFENRVLEQSTIIKASNNTMKTKASTLGARFFNAPWSNQIQPRFKALISWYQQLVSYYENLGTISAEPMSVENDCLLYLTHRLLSLPYEISLTPFEEIVRLSILVYSSIRVWSLYGMPCLEVLVGTLRKSLCKSYRTLQSTNSDLLFWILFVGSLASRGMECHSWFLAHLVDVADQLSLEGWGSAISVLQGFLFVCRSADEPAKELWNFTLRGGSMTGLGVVTTPVHNDMVIR